MDDRRGQDDNQNQPSGNSPVINHRMTDFRKILKSFESADPIRSSNSASSSTSSEHTPHTKYQIPSSEKKMWLSEMKRLGITYTFDLEAQPLFPHVQAYALFFHDQSRLMSGESWLLNLRHFLRLVSENSSDDAAADNKLTKVFYLVERKDVNEDVAIKKFVRGKLVSDNVIKETKETNTAKNSSRNKGDHETPVSDILSRLAKTGAEFMKLEVGIGLPLAVLKHAKFLVLEAELPPTLTGNQSNYALDRVAFFTNFMESLNDLKDSQYKFYVIQRFDSSNARNFSVAIRQYINGSLVIEDLYSEYENFQKLCLIRMTKDADDEKDPRLPRRKAFLQIACPCSGGNAAKRWSCADCLEDVIYGYDGYLYCLCGKSNVNLKLTFRCDAASHGQRFQPILGKVMTTYLDKLEPIEEINILILGETGVGKSTFINSFANYSVFSSLEEASDSDLLALIPTSFTVVDDKMEERVASTGVDENEVLIAGASATQSCRSYVVRHGDRMIHLIDTPGIGDVRGLEWDTKNFENIMSFISHFDSIHGICVLLKPNLSRINTVFQFCVKGLLCQLHKSASENIMFCFTSTKGTYYKPGDSLPILRSLLEGIRENEPNVTIPLNPDNIFCFDSEAFRYLVAINSGFEFSEENRANYQQSWERSAYESRRLLERVIKLKPHVVTDTLSLSQCRKMVIALSKPLADISQNIQQNIALLEEHKKTMTKTTEDISILNQKLHVPVLDFETTILDEPRTVCTSKSCVETFMVSGVRTLVYKTVCHKPCYLKATSEVVKCKELLKCWAMKGFFTKKCRICKCSWKRHMHIYYEVRLKSVHARDVDIQYDVNSKESVFKSVRKVIEECEKRQKALEDEQRAITNACAKFAQFMKRNAITPYNDTIQDYLDYLLEVEEMNSSDKDDRKEAIAYLEKLKREYLAQIEILDDSMKARSLAGTSLKPADIATTIDDLYKLRMYGTTVKKMGNLMQQATRNEHDASAFDKNSMASVTVKKKKQNMFKKISEIEAKTPSRSTGVFFS